LTTRNHSGCAEYCSRREWNDFQFTNQSARYF